MRVLHLSSGNLYGGIERLLATYAEQRHLCPEMEPTFVFAFEGKIAEQIRASGAPIHRVPSARFSRPWTTWASRRAFKKLLNELPAFDVAITHATWSHALYAPVIRARQIPLAFMAHDAHLNVTSLDQLAARTKPDWIIANSAFTASTVHSVFPGVGVEVCNIPVVAPVTDRQPTRAKIRRAIGTADDVVVIVCTARLESWKGQSLLLDALSKLTVQGWEAWIGGGAQRPHEVEYFEALRRKVREYQLDDRVKFLGHRSDVPEVLEAADLYCQPNLSPEPFGIAFIEAMFAGLPVVTTRLGAPMEFVDPSCGRLVPPNDQNGLTAALQELLSDAATRTELGTRGRSHARELCDPARQINLLSQQLQRLLAKRPAFA